MSAHDWARAALGIELGHQLGSGKFASVFEARDLGSDHAWPYSGHRRWNGTTLAVKVVDVTPRPHESILSAGPNRTAYDDFQIEVNSIVHLQQQGVQHVVAAHASSVQMDKQCARPVHSC